MKLINPEITLFNSYLSFEFGDKVFVENISIISSIMDNLDTFDVFLDPQLSLNLLKLDTEKLLDIKKELESEYKIKKGYSLQENFATKNNVNKEVETLNDFYKRIYMYISSYQLKVVPLEILDWISVEEEKEVKRGYFNNKEENFRNMNFTFNLIEFKTLKEFKNKIKNTFNMPIVFGENEMSLIYDIYFYEKELFLEIFENTELKVKENLFKILSLLGIKDITNMNILKTSNDIIRYALMCSNLDYTNIDIHKGKVLYYSKVDSKGNHDEINTKIDFSKFGINYDPEKNDKGNVIHTQRENAIIKLKTSEKKFIAKNLEVLGKRNFEETFGDMKPKYSLWLSISKNMHPQSKKYIKYPNMQLLFKKLQNNENVKTFNSLKEEYIFNNDIKSLIDLLITKPGVLMRSLDMILRKCDKKEVDYLIKNIEENSNKFNPKLILEIGKYLDFRTDNKLKKRYFNVKGEIIEIVKPIDKLGKKRVKKLNNGFRDIMLMKLKGKELLPEIKKD